MKISVIIPVLNESACLPATIDSVRAGIPDAQIIAIDGGSVDGSAEWLESQPDVWSRTGVRGKGPQQNAGATLAAGDVLVFLHADCQLPSNAGERLREELRSPGNVGGCFYIRFAERRPLSLHVLATGMNLRARIFRRSFGDQVLFIRRAVFERIGGFPDWPLFEDYELVRRMKRVGQFAVISSPATLSARRFLAHGVWRTVARVFLLQGAYYLGIPPRRLKHWFADIRPHLKQTSVDCQNPNQHDFECEGGGDVGGELERRRRTRT